MTQFLAPIANDQQEDANGAPLSGGTVETYLAGSSTPATTTSDKAGLVPNTWPITLNTLGVNSQGAVWITGGASYKFVIKSSVGVVQRTIDNVSGINDNTVATTDQWVVYQGVPTYISATSFSVAGDQTATLTVGRRIKTTDTGGVGYGSVVSSTYSSPNTIVVVSNDSIPLDAGLSSVSYGLLSVLNTSVPSVYPGMRNRLINGNFIVNQRAVSGTVTLAAGVYGHDRWKAGAAGCTYTFAASGADVLLTITAGSLQQVVEGVNIEGGSYVMSWTGTATGKIGAGTLSPSGVVGSGTANANLTVEFSTGTLTKVQLEPSLLSPFERRPYGLELSLCQRYLPVFTAANGNEAVGSGQAVSTTIGYIYYPFKVPARVIPTGFTATGGYALTSSTGAGSTLSVLGVQLYGVNGVIFSATVPAVLTAGNATMMFSTTAGLIYFNGCEL